MNAHRALVVAMLAALASWSAQAQTSGKNFCPLDVSNEKLLACARSLPADSPEAVLAYANLGTRALEAGDRKLAGDYYKHTVIEGKTVIVDAKFHSLRAVAFHAIGLDKEALADARTSLRIMDTGKVDLQGRDLTDEAESGILAPLLETLLDMKAPEAESALQRYLALPVENWFDAANRSAVLSQVGRYQEAEPLLDQALKAQPNHPGLLNNKCDLLVKLKRTGEALAFCEKAVAAAPSEAAFFDTYADALNAAGKCTEAKAARDRASALFPGNPKYRKKLSCEAG